MKVLVACEYSGTVRDAFTALGHDATSCDMLVKVYGADITFDYSNAKVASTCRVYLIWGVN